MAILWRLLRNRVRGYYGVYMQWALFGQSVIVVSPPALLGGVTLGGQVCQ